MSYEQKVMIMNVTRSRKHILMSEVTYVTICRVLEPVNTCMNYVRMVVSFPPLVSS